MEFINYNGKFFQSNEPIILAQSRGLRYGDGLFETIKLINNKLILAEKHFDRLWQGLTFLKFELPKLFTKQKLQDEVLQLAKKNKLKNARVRLTIIRSSGGIYDAANNFPNYIIETIPLPESNGSFNINGLQLCTFKDSKKAIDSFSNIKTNNYLPYFMGALHAKENHCNDAIILNSENNICDTTIANIFYIKNEIFYTPNLNQGCVAGVMRSWIVESLITLGYTVKETLITEADILLADEVFLTNSIYNVRWVACIYNVNFTNKLLQKVVVQLQTKFTDIFI